MKQPTDEKLKALVGSLRTLLQASQAYRDSAAISAMTRLNTGRELDTAIGNATAMLSQFEKQLKNESTSR